MSLFDDEYDPNAPWHFDDEPDIDSSDFEEEENEEEPEICPDCNGSGEGMFDGSTCWSCKGSGVERK